MEIETIVQQMKLSKAPGLDGLTMVFYRMFKSELSPYLKELFSYCQEHYPRHGVKQDWSWFQKKEKDMRQPEAYHPISILNTDYKILVSILANMLNGTIGAYVNQEQTGFI